MPALTGQPRQSLNIRTKLERVDQANLVLGIVAAIIVFGALTTSGFLDLGNFKILLAFSTGAGVVAVGLAFVVLGKGVDLSVGAVALASGQVALELMSRGWSEPSALVAVAILAVLVGVINGYLVAVVGVPSLFVTLGTGPLLLGGVRIFLLDSNLYTLPSGTLLEKLGSGTFLGLPIGVFCAGLVFIAAWFCWSYMSYGQLLRSIGDNFNASRFTGAPVRALQLSSYVISATLAAFGGLLIVAREGSVVTTGSAFSPLLFTAFTVVVIGGVSLSGGRGSIYGVLMGVLFIGLITNLLTLNDLSSTVQDFARGMTLLAAIVIDAWLHPPDEETARSGEL